MSFEDFWEAYDYKVGRKKASLLYSKLSDADRELISEHVPFYVRSTPDKQFRKHPTTYLNGEHWHDEIPGKRAYSYGEVIAIHNDPRDPRVMSDFEINDQKQWLHR